MHDGGLARLVVGFNPVFQAAGLTGCDVALGQQSIPAAKKGPLSSTFAFFRLPLNYRARDGQ
jgi:hypothetical protein